MKALAIGLFSKRTRPLTGCTTGRPFPQAGTKAPRVKASSTRPCRQDGLRGTGGTGMIALLGFMRVSGGPVNDARFVRKASRCRAGIIPSSVVGGALKAMPLGPLDLDDDAILHDQRHCPERQAAQCFLDVL